MWGLTEVGVEACRACAAPRAVLVRPRPGQGVWGSWQPGLIILRVKSSLVLCKYIKKSPGESPVLKCLALDCSLIQELSTEEHKVWLRFFVMVLSLESSIAAAVQSAVRKLRVLCYTLCKVLCSQACYLLFATILF